MFTFHIVIIPKELIITTISVIILSSEHCKSECSQYYNKKYILFSTSNTSKRA